MKDLTRCNICLGISEYDLNLMNANLERKDIERPREMTLALQMNVAGIEKVAQNKCMVSIITKLICFNKDLIQKMKKSKELEKFEEDKASFKIELVYDVNILFNKETSFDLNNKDTEKSIKDYAWFVLYPTLRETFNNLANKIGMSNINIPYDMSRKSNDD